MRALLHRRRAERRDNRVVYRPLLTSGTKRYQTMSIEGVQWIQMDAPLLARAPPSGEFQLAID
ncbi:hypothetical protein NOVOSPHI9U_370015 [Novosphingobium sp. 9U]|nr:hypothetical protein NOVOSPHI9U_370015 [Novosphingobium sp. 9U]